MEAQNNAGWKKLHHSGFPEIYTVIPDVQGTGGERFAHPQYETTVRAKGACIVRMDFRICLGQSTVVFEPSGKSKAL